ncbi:MAG: ribokinase [Planctomycetota bacterium]
MSAEFTPTVVVVGSANMDLVVRAAEIPSAGQTVLGRDFHRIPGGKGGNQAVAAARLGARVAFVGRVGADEFGRSLRDALESEQINCTRLLETPGAPSGVALIVVADAGENAICVAAGANGRLSPADIDAAEELIATARVCVLQLEIPLDTAVRAAALARRHGVEVVLDPAPAPAALPPELLAVDILTPNTSEAARLIGMPCLGDAPARAAVQLHACGAKAVVMKLGHAGAYLSAPPVERLFPAHSVQVVDTTAAGDAFTAGLAVARAAGHSLEEAVCFANAAGALACTRLGAQPSLPHRAEVEALVRRAT